MINVRSKLVVNRFRELSRQAQRTKSELNAKNAMNAAVIARQLCPVGETGNLKASIAVELNRTTSAATLTAGNEKVDYAAYVEYGTANSPAQPFITPAIESVKKTMRNRRVRVYR